MQKKISLINCKKIIIILLKHIKMDKNKSKYNPKYIIISYIIYFLIKLRAPLTIINSINIK